MELNLAGDHVRRVAAAVPITARRRWRVDPTIVFGLVVGLFAVSCGPYAAPTETFTPRTVGVIKSIEQVGEARQQLDLVGGRRFLWDNVTTRSLLSSQPSVGTLLLADDSTPGRWAMIVFRRPATDCYELADSPAFIRGRRIITWSGLDLPMAPSYEPHGAQASGGGYAGPAPFCLNAMGEITSYEG